ncbi:hypothetical protein B0T16DRAFT_459949 [Cercophora newfieldiana]|uniref:Uncharacterized protein n=1 Tax=Cercophora newfieldiana TaxID=92897 RepID=A0AA40CNT5_9PEZI|nr:hypothetical protein B0T16DRAFT_459949 [Cercophora newfieldiana]
MESPHSNKLQKRTKKSARARKQNGSQTPASSLAPTGKLFVPWPVPQELRDMIWEQVLLDGNSPHCNIPSCLKGIPGNLPLHYHITEDGKSVPMKVEVANLITTQLHPILSACRESRAFAMRHAAKCQATNPVSRKVFKFQPAPVFSGIDPVPMASSPQRRLRWTQTKSDQQPSTSGPALGWSANSLSDLPLVVLGKRYFSEQPPASDSPQNDPAMLRAWEQQMTERLGMIETLSDTLDKQLMVLHPSTWHWEIYLVMPKITAVASRWQALGKQGRYIIDLEEKQLWRQLRRLFQGATWWMATEGGSSFPHCPSDKDVLPEFIEEICGERNEDFGCLRQEALETIPDRVLGQANLNREDKGLAPLAMENIRVGVQFTLLIHFEEGPARKIR